MSDPKSLRTELVERMARSIVDARSEGGESGWDDPDVGDTWRDIYRADASAALTAALAFLAERGMKVVPVEATPEMSSWNNTGVHVPLGERIYVAMLAATPNLLEADDGK